MKIKFVIPAHAGISFFNQRFRHYGRNDSIDIESILGEYFQMKDKKNIPVDIKDPLLDKVNLHREKQYQKLSRRASTIGIDIGTGSVNIAQTAKYKGKLTLIKTAVVDIKKRVDGDQEQATLKALREALSYFNTKKAKFACVVNCPQTCVRKVVAPYMPKKDLLGAVSLEVKQSIPFPLESAVLDYSVIEEVIENGVEKLSIIVAAAPKQTIDQLLSFFTSKKAKPFSGTISKKFEGEKKLSSLGLKISAILPLPLCLENIIECSKLKMNETLVTIEMGTVVTELNIYKNACLQFSRKIPFSGNDITQSLRGVLMTDQGKIELTVQEAEQIKREYGIPKIEENKVIDGKLTTNQILSFIRPKVEQLVNEIERSFDFYLEKMHGGKVERVVLFGGGAQLKGLTEFLSKELAMDVNVGNPLADIDLLFDQVVERETDAHRLVLAIGASLSSLRGINLLAVETNEKAKRLVYKVFFPAGVIIVTMLFLLNFIPLQIKTSNLEKKLIQVKEALNVRGAQLQSIKESVVIDQVLAARPSLSEALKEISNVVPSNMYLNGINMTKDVLSLEGIIEGQGSSEASLSQFMVELEKGLFKNVRLLKSKRVDKDSLILEFEITCRME